MKRSEKKFMLLLVFGVFYSLSFTPFLYGQNLVGFKDYFGSKGISIKSLESDHFKVSWAHPRNELFVRALLIHAEAAHQELAPIFMRSSRTKKVPIEIFPDLQTFSAVSQLPIARFRATGTIALTLEQRLMLLSPRNALRGYGWSETLVHEYIHYLIREITAQYIPIWLHEGAAQYYQGYPNEKDTNLRPSQWGLFKKYRDRGGLLSLKTLYQPFPMRRDPEEAELAYVQALLFVKWLDGKCGVLKLIREAAKKNSLDQALQSCTGMTEKELASTFLPDIMGEVEIPVDRYVEFYAQDLSSQNELEAEGRKADQASRNFAQLSSEMFKQGRYRGASIEMEKALKMTPVSPPSWRRQLALSHQKSGDDARFKRVLGELLRDYPQDAAAWYLLGKKAIENKKFQLAKRHFTKAFYVNPFLDGLESDMRALGQRDPELAFDFLPKVESP